MVDAVLLKESGARVAYYSVDMVQKNDSTHTLSTAGKWTYNRVSQPVPSSDCRLQRCSSPFLIVFPLLVTLPKV